MSTQQRDWNKDAEEIDRVGGIVSIVVAVIVGTPASTLLRMSLEADARRGNLLSVALATAPLTLAVALITVGFARKWFGEGSGVLLGPAAIMLTSLFVAGQIGYSQQALWSDTMSMSGGWHQAAVAVVVNILFGYMKVYGLAQFISALLIGGFVAWAVSEKLMPKRKS